MNPTHPATLHRLFSGLAGVVQPTLAYEIDRPVRPRGPYKGGDCLNESVKLSLVESGSSLPPVLRSVISVTAPINSRPAGCIVQWRELSRGPA